MKFILSLLVPVIKLTFILSAILIVLIAGLNFYALRGIPNLPQVKAFAYCAFDMRDTYKENYDYYLALATSHVSNYPVNTGDKVELIPLPPMSVKISENVMKTCTSGELMKTYYKSLRKANYKLVTTLDGRKQIEFGTIRVQVSIPNNKKGIVNVGIASFDLGE